MQQCNYCCWSFTTRDHCLGGREGWRERLLKWTAWIIQIVTQIWHEWIDWWKSITQNWKLQTVVEATSQGVVSCVWISKQMEMIAEFQKCQDSSSKDYQLHCQFAFDICIHLSLLHNPVKWNSIASCSCTFDHHLALRNVNRYFGTNI